MCFGFSTRKMLITLMFSVVAMNLGLFPVSHIQLMSRCAGAGREHSQAASPSWPMEMFHTINFMLSLEKGVSCGRGSYRLFSFCIL